MSDQSNVWVVFDPKNGPEFVAACREGAHEHINDCLDEGIHKAARWVVREYVPYADAHAMRAALENVMTLAARHRKEGWAGHMLRLCADAGVRPKVLRDAGVKP